MTTTVTAPTAPAAVVEQTRLRALGLPVEFVLRHTTFEDWVPQMHHALENRWVEAIGILGLEPDEWARALLYLGIDWNKHDSQRNSGQFIVRSTKDKHPEGATSSPVTAAWFRDVAIVRRLAIEGRVRLTEEVDHDRKLRARALRELGLLPTSAKRIALLSRAGHNAEQVMWVLGGRDGELHRALLSVYSFP